MRRLPEALLQNASKTQLQLKGQAVVEFALLMPLLLFMVLGFIETQFLFAARHTMQVKADVLAQTIAEQITAAEPWETELDALVLSEREGSRCATAPDVTVDFPDTTTNPGDRVKIHWSCPYDPMIQGIWPELNVGVESEAVIRLPEPTPTPELSPPPSLLQSPTPY